MFCWLNEEKITEFKLFSGMHLLLFMHKYHYKWAGGGEGGGESSKSGHFCYITPVWCRLFYYNLLYWAREVSLYKGSSPFQSSHPKCHLAPLSEWLPPWDGSHLKAYVLCQHLWPSREEMKKHSLEATSVMDSFLGSLVGALNSFQLPQDLDAPAILAFIQTLEQSLKAAADAFARLHLNPILARWIQFC